MKRIYKDDMEARLAQRREMSRARDRAGLLRWSKEHAARVGELRRVTTLLLVSRRPTHGALSMPGTKRDLAMYSESLALPCLALPCLAFPSDGKRIRAPQIRRREKVELQRSLGLLPDVPHGTI